MVSEPKPVLFISYRRSDSPDAVKLIYERIKARLTQWDVFYDHKSIGPGEMFPERLREQVTAARVVLAIIGPTWLDVLKARAKTDGVDHVRSEIRLAIESGRLIIPVTVANTGKLSDSDLAQFPDLLVLANLNARSIRPEPDFDHDFEQLAIALEGLGPGEGIGTILNGKYRIVRELGAGGMGIVYAAEQLHPRRNVAVKLIKPGMDTREVLARFDAERQALAVLDHPNIARVLDAGTATSGRPYFAMELVNGSPITQYCDDRRLSPNDRLPLFKQVCDGVQHAHLKGIIHRDLKPGNILVEVVDGQPVPKIIDFGLAKALGYKLTDKTLLTQLDTRVGTLEYSSPEQAAGRTAEVDTRTDIYSLGVLLYELLVGSPPFDRAELMGAGDEEMRRVIREKDPLRPSAKLSSSSARPSIAANRQVEPAGLAHLLRGDLDWIVMKALEKEPARRYETANGFAADVQRYLTNQPVEARPPSAAYFLRKFTRRHRGPVAAAAAVLFALVAGLITTGLALDWALREKRNADDQTRLAKSKSHAESIARKAADDANRTAQERAAELSRALYRNKFLLASAAWREKDAERAETILSGCEESLRGFEWHYLKKLAQPPRELAAARSEWVSEIRVNRDGTFLAVCGLARRKEGEPLGDEVKLIDLRTDTVVRSIWADQCEFTPDGQALVVASPEDNQISVYDVNSNKLRHAFPGNRFAIHPSGELLVAIVGIREHYESILPVSVWNLTSGDRISKFEFQGEGYAIGFTGTDNRVIVAREKILTKLPDPQREFVEFGFWDSTTGELTEAVEGPEVPLGGSLVKFSPDGRYAWVPAILNSNSTLEVYNTSTGKSIFASSSDPNLGNVRHTKGVRALEFSADSQRVVFSGYDNAVRVWDLETRIEQFTLSGHSNLANVVIHNSTSGRVASAFSDRTIRVWDLLQDGQLVFDVPSRDDSVHALAYLPEDNRLVSGGSDGIVRIWDLDSAPFGKLKSEGSSPRAIKLVVDDTRIATVNSDRTARVWSAKDLSAQFSVSLGDEPDQPTIYYPDIALSPDRSRIAIAGIEDIWVVADSGDNELYRLRGFVSPVAFSPDGKRLIAFQDRRGLNDTLLQDNLQSRVQDEGARRVLEMLMFPGVLGDHYVVDILKDQPELLAELKRRAIGRMVIVDAETGRLENVIEAKTQVLAFHPDGKLVAMIVDDEVIVLELPPARTDVSDSTSLADFPRSEAKVVSKLAGTKSAFGAMTFSPDGRWLVTTAGIDTTIDVWETATWKRVAELPGGSELTRGLAFTSDSTRLATGGSDRIMRLWDTETWELLWAFEGTAMKIQELAFSSDDRRLFAACYQGSGFDESGEILIFEK